jgi:hypothetical protein
VLAQQQQIAEARRTVQLERFHLVKRLQAAGRTGQAIINETGIGRASVRKWLRLRELPTRNRMAPQPGMPVAFREYLHINRLKTLRRQMYSPAGVDLLRARLLPLPELVVH